MAERADGSKPLVPHPIRRFLSNTGNHTFGLFHGYRPHGSTRPGGQLRSATKVIMPKFLSSAFRTSLLLLALVMAPAQPLFAQGPKPDLALWKTASIEPALSPATPVSFAPVQPVPHPHHRFWDTENRSLFATVAAASAADFYFTHENLASGGRELNPVTRLFCGSTAGLALSFTGQTAGVIGLSYFFHRTGHHRLERAAALVNIGASATAATYSATHR